MYREQYYYSVPHQTLKNAKLFAKLMKKPWKAEVKMEKTSPGGSAVVMKKGAPRRRVKPTSYYGWEAKGLRKLFDSELLNGALSGKAQIRKKDFDIRPLVKRDLVNCLKEDESKDLRCPLAAMNIVRKAVGLKPLPKGFFEKRPGMEIIRFLKKKHKPDSYSFIKLSRLDPFLANCYKAKKYRKKGMLLIEVLLKRKTRLASISALLTKKFDNVEKVYRLDYPPGRNVIIIARY